MCWNLLLHICIVWLCDRCTSVVSILSRSSSCAIFLHINIKISNKRLWKPYFWRSDTVSSWNWIIKKAFFFKAVFSAQIFHFLVYSIVLINLQSRYTNGEKKGIHILVRQVKYILIHVFRDSQCKIFFVTCPTFFLDKISVIFFVTWWRKVVFSNILFRISTWIPLHPFISSCFSNAVNICWRSETFSGEYSTVSFSSSFKHLVLTMGRCNLASGR